jgi:hypothetical protein
MSAKAAWEAAKSALGKRLKQLRALLLCHVHATGWSNKTLKAPPNLSGLCGVPERHIDVTMVAWVFSPNF